MPGPHSIDCGENAYPQPVVEAGVAATGTYELLLGPMASAKKVKFFVDGEHGAAEFEANTETVPAVMVATVTCTITASCDWNSLIVPLTQVVDEKSR